MVSLFRYKVLHDRSVCRFAHSPAFTSAATELDAEL